MPDPSPIAVNGRPPTAGASRWLKLVGLIALCLGVGGIGAWATTPEIETWYRTLQKPSFTPPDWVFGPVWTTLYVLMAIAAWRVGQSGGWRRQLVPLSLFGTQLGLNLAWSWIFFAAHQIGWALVEIIALWFAIGATTILFFRESRLAGALMLPYWLWVTYATALNAAIWRLNT